MGLKQDSSRASEYLEQLEALLSENNIQEMKLALINDLKLLFKISGHSNWTPCFVQSQYEKGGTALQAKTNGIPSPFSP